MAEIDRGIDSMDRLIALANNAQNVGPRDLRQAVQIGVPKAERMARKFLTSQLNRSGIKRRTGQLMNMLKRSKVTILDPASARVSLKIAMPAGLEKEDYQKANSLNYGAVRASKDSAINQKGANGKRLVGAKQVQKLKERAQSLSGKSFYSTISGNLGARSAGKTESGSTKIETTGGGVTVTKSFKFFYLTDSQIDTIKNIIFGNAMDYIQAKIAGKRSLRKAA